MRIVVVAMMLALAGGASAQEPAMLFAGKLDLAVRTGDSVIADCTGLVPAPEDGVEAPPPGSVACVKPGPEGMQPSMRHYMQGLVAAGFERQQSNMQTPVFFFCRKEEMVALSMVRPDIVMNEDLDFVDETGKVVDFEDMMAKAPIALMHMPEGPCSFF